MRILNPPAGSPPLLITAFVNRIGTIGLTLVPALLVEHQFSSATSTGIMSLSRLGMIAGTLASGWFVDFQGPRLTLLLALLLTSAGLFALPLSSKPAWVALFVVVAQFGNAMYPSSIRLLLVSLVKGEESQRESLGWVRMVNNFGQVVSFGAGAVFGGWGLLPLFWLDAFTGFFSAEYARRFVPKSNSVAPPSPLRSPFGILNSQSHFRVTLKSQEKRLVTAFGLGVLGMGFSFFYDLFMITASAKLSLLQGAEGVRWFSLSMLTNTALCAALAVKSSRFFARPEKVIPIAVVLGFASNWIAFGIEDSNQVQRIFFGILILTAAELGFFATSTFALLQWIPKSAYQGRIHSLLVLLQVTGRWIAATISFPVLIHGSIENTQGILTFVLIPILGVAAWVYPRVTQGVPSES